MRNLEKTLKALANGRRLAIVKHLKENKEAPVGELASEISASFKATSKRLTILYAADIVDQEQRGLQMYYWLREKQKPICRHLLNPL